MKQEAIERLIADAQTKEEVIAAIAPDALTAREQALFMAALLFASRKNKPVSKTTTFTASFNHEANTLDEALGIDIDNFKPKYDDLLSELEISKLRFEQQMRRLPDDEDKGSRAKEIKTQFKLNKSHVFEMVSNTFDSEVERMFAICCLTDTPFL